jgi:hypothetical protein
MLLCGNRSLGVLLGVMALAGCGVKRDYITINYTPLSGARRVSGAEAVAVRVQAVYLNSMTL